MHPAPQWRKIIANILIADDEADVRATLRLMLARAGRRVVEAADGVEALERYRAERPHVTITDILMPHRSGLATIMEIRDPDPDTPVLAISGGGKQGKISRFSAARTFHVTSSPGPLRPGLWCRWGLWAGP